MTNEELIAASDLAEVLRRTAALLATLQHDTPDDLLTPARHKMIARRRAEIADVLDAADHIGIKATDETQTKTYALPRTVW